MYWLSFDLNFLITSLVSSNSSYPSRASELNPGFCGVHGAWSLVFCVVFCRSLFLFFVFPLYCLSFDLRILITPLVSSNSSYPSRASELNPGFCGVHGAWSLVFCVVFCRSLFLGFLSIVLSVLRFMDSDNPLGIFKLFLSLLKPLKF